MGCVSFANTQKKTWFLFWSQHVNGLNKIVKADLCLFLYSYQVCYISGPPIPEDMSLASKLENCLLQNWKSWWAALFGGPPYKTQSSYSLNHICHGGSSGSVLRGTMQIKWPFEHLRQIQRNIIFQFLGIYWFVCLNLQNQYIGKTDLLILLKWS